MTETRGDDLLRSPTDTLRAAALQLRVDVFEERREWERRHRLGEIGPDDDTDPKWLASCHMRLATAAWLERWVTLAMLADVHGPYGEPDLQHALTVAKAVLGTS